MEKERTIIIREKDSGGALKVVAMVALVLTSPFWIILVPSLFLFGMMTFFDNGPWFFVAAVALFSLLLAVRDRVSGKHDTKRLQRRIEELELELCEVRQELSGARLELLQIHEEREFMQQLNEHKSS